ncbi:MAG TPA: DUF6547 family protein [Terriglobales bacterium]|jgi:hypothetical protein|nr:DUF6547 family protein [Terriglobales bacterium]
MSDDRQPSRPIDAYKQIIDQLVTETSHGVREKAVVRETAFPDLSDDRVFNPFIKSLSTGQRQMLAQMLHAERVAAIHDALAVLTWWVLARGVGLTFRGEPMPVELSGAGLHGDYIGRLDDWQWPKDDTQPAS